MASSFSFTLFSPTEIVTALHCYGIAPSPTLYADHVKILGLASSPRSSNSSSSTFLGTPAACSPSHLDLASSLHLLALWGRRRIYKRANAFLQSIQFQDHMLRGLLRADSPLVVYILSAPINFLHRHDSSQPITKEYGPLEERMKKLMAKIAEQLEKEFHALKWRLHDYNREQLSLHVASKSHRRKDRVKT
ncbi:uncharacterized protein LOC8073288 [Sorghum bicolor]|uniref:uncharacterized protein LOC8073288 n=1 Tax=Sorghum bicolor TaxID=4558 RepID=UPI0001A87CAF|nr:uncharacterized protein LOC8073288 [Sorghum bicolor]|eukprot:XP_021320641.1 uncharacterized protein LOC8073288 [Sorghum bicolor]